MGTVALALRVALAAVFVTAGVGKLLDRRGSRTALADFGVPEPLQGLAALLLPLAELAVAGALLGRASALWGAGGALALLIAFIAGIAAALRRGRAPECHCFGQIHSGTAGPSTLARNAALAALAIVVIAVGPGPSINGWVAARSAAQLALAAAVMLVLTGVIAAASRWSDRRASERAQRDSLRPPGLPRGSAAPAFVAVDLEGRAVGSGALLTSGRPLVLIFIHPHCGPCMGMIADLARWQATLAERVRIMPISQGDPEDVGALARRHGLREVLVEPKSEVYDAYEMRGTPSAVVVQDGTIASTTAQGSLEIEELIRLTVRRAATQHHAEEASSSNARAASSASPRVPARTDAPATA